MSVAVNEYARDVNLRNGELQEISISPFTDKPFAFTNAHNVLDHDRNKGWRDTENRLHMRSSHPLLVSHVTPRQLGVRRSRFGADGDSPYVTHMPTLLTRRVLEDLYTAYRRELARNDHDGLVPTTRFERALAWAAVDCVGGVLACGRCEAFGLGSGCRSWGRGPANVQGRMSLGVPSAMARPPLRPKRLVHVGGPVRTSSCTNGHRTM